MNRSCVLLLWVGLVVSPGYAMSEDAPVPGGSWWKTPDQRGAELLQSGDAAGASQVFRDSRWRGVSQYRNGNFAEAQKEFSTGTDPSSLYNAGTAAARAGDYETAIEKFEQVIEADPDHEDAAHNLDISRQLRKKQQQSSDQQGESSDSDDSEQSDDSQSQQGDQEQGEQNQGDQQQDGQAQDGQQQEGEQGQQSEQQSGHSDQSSGEDSNQDGKGELSSDAEDAKAAGQDAQQQEATGQSEENQSAVSQGQDETQQSQEDRAKQAQADAESAEAGDADRATESARREPISESEQATEQWMRRIPDDPSQLLRNKIKLNHMIQHENVTDLPEPW